MKPKSCSLGIIFLLLLLLLSLSLTCLYMHLLPHPPCPSSSSLSPSTSTQPHAVKGRILYMAASYTLNQYIFLWASLNSLLDICNTGWDVEIHLQVANGLHTQHDYFRQLQSSLYCESLGKEIPIRLSNFSDIGFGLNSRHRAIIQRELSRFDYFIYAEEDMQFTLSHLQSFLAANNRLTEIYGAEKALRYTPGFLRSEMTILVCY
jgi:hypothetical protein